MIEYSLDDKRWQDKIKDKIVEMYRNGKLHYGE